MVVLLVTRRSAMTLRIPESGTRVLLPGGKTGTGMGFASGLGVVATVVVSFFESSVSELTVRISFSTIRPPGPEPVTVERSTPFSRATFLARGEAFTRSLLVDGAFSETIALSDRVAAFSVVGVRLVAASFAGVASPAPTKTARRSPTATLPPSAT